MWFLVISRGNINVTHFFQTFGQNYSNFTQILIIELFEIETWSSILRKENEKYEVKSFVVIGKQRWFEAYWFRQNVRVQKKVFNYL